MRSIKKEIRILAFDDASFTPRSKGKVAVVGVVFKGGREFEGMIKTEVEIDGLDATDVVAEVVNKSKYKEELRVLMFKGVTIAGFNVIDIKKLNEKIKLPVIIVSRKLPDFLKIKKALKHFEDGELRWEAIKNAGKVNKLKTENNKNVYYQFSGLDSKEAEKIILLSCTRSSIPEPLRVAHMIASALVKGESGGRA